MTDHTPEAVSAPPADEAPASPIAAPPAPSPASLSPHEIAALADKLEALLITSGRAVAHGRLAVALGLALSEETAAAPTETVQATPKPEPENTSETAPSAPPEQVHTPAPKARRRRARADAAPSPEQTIQLAAAHLNEIYTRAGRSFRVENVAGGYRLMTLPQYAPVIAALQGAHAQARLSKAAIESLAIIAYKQPVTRATLEAIRGVACGEILKTLMDRRLITIAGRAEELGRPILYSTSKGFLEAFGLSSLKDLPTVAELGLRG